MVDQRKRSLQLSVFLVAFFLLWALRHTLFSAVDESIASPTVRWAYSNLVKLVLWVFPAAAFVRVLRSASPARYLGLSIWPSWRNWVLCIGMTVAFLLAVTVFEFAVHKSSLSTSVFSQPLALLLVQLLPGPLLEELFFRGFLMKELLALARLSRALALNALLFAGIHVVYWLTQGATAQAIAANAAACFVFSLLAGWLFARTGSIWPSTCAHIVNNLLFSVLAVSRVQPVS